MAKIDPRILTILPSPQSEPAWLSTAEVGAKLERIGYDIDYLKKVRRWLQALEDDGLATSRKEGKETLWQCKEGATGLSHHAKGFMNFDEALALQILQRFSAHQLPELVNTTLKPLFEVAGQRLARPQDAREKRYQAWGKKIDVASGAFQLLRPQVKPEVMQQVTDALFLERWLEVRYRPNYVKGEKSLKYTLTPLALIEAGDNFLYLVQRCRMKDGSLSGTGTFRLDRMSQATILDEDFDYPQEFSLAKFLHEEKRLEFFIGEKTRVTLKVTEQAAKFLRETPISEDQTMTTSRDGSVTLKGTVVISHRFRQWLRSMGQELEVISPKQLRTGMVEEVRAMHALYFNGTSK